MPTPSPKAKYQREALEAASDARIGRSARALLSELVALSWRGEGPDGWTVTDTPVSALGGRLNIRDRQVRRLIRTLADAGLVRVLAGGGRTVATYILTTSIAAEIRPVLSVAPDARTRRRSLDRALSITGDPHIERGQKRPGTPVISDRAPRTKTTALGVSSFYTSKTKHTITSEHAPAGGGGALSGEGENGVPDRSRRHGLPARRFESSPPDSRPDDGRDLDGREAVVFEKLTQRPSWAKGSAPWVSSRMARRLAKCETVTIEVVDAALAATRERIGSLRAPAGFLVDQVREPDWIAIEAERERRRRAVERDRQEAEERARRAAERSEVFRAADEAERRRAAIVATLPADELERIVDEWIRTEAPRPRAQALAMRTPAERVRSVLRFGDIDHKLEGVGA